MKQPKRISFDFWKTLYLGNPDYIKKRSEILRNMFFNDFTSEFISDIMHDIGKRIDDVELNSFSKKSIKPNQCFKTLFRLLNKQGTFAHVSKAERINDAIFLEYPPIKIREDLANVLQRLQARNIELFITCNTGWVGRDTIVEMLVDTGMSKFFNDWSFSDYSGYVKPHSKAFSHLTPKDALHIGDTFNTDIIGANNYGIRYLHIKPENKLDELVALMDSWGI